MSKCYTINKLVEKEVQMATKEYEYWNERIIQKNSTGTYTITIPVNVIRNLKWRQGQRVIIEEKGKSVTIKDAPNRR